MVKESTLRARASNASLQAARASADLGSTTKPDRNSRTTETRRPPFYEYTNLENGASPFTAIPQAVFHSSFAASPRQRPVSESFAFGSTASQGKPISTAAGSVSEESLGIRAEILPPLPPKILKQQTESKPDRFMSPVSSSSAEIQRISKALPNTVDSLPCLTKPPPFAAITPWGTVSSSPHFSKPAFGVPGFQSLTNTALQSGAKDTIPSRLPLAPEKSLIQNTDLDVGHPGCQTCIRKGRSCMHHERVRREKGEQTRYKGSFDGCDDTFSQIETLETHVQRHADPKPEDYTLPFCQFLSENPTVFHAVDFFGKRLASKGFKKLSERSLWTDELKTGGKYYVERNGSSLIAFTIGDAYTPGNGVAMIAGHVDAITARLKPVSSKKTSAGYIQLGVAPYAGGLNATWWDRDLSIGGKVLVKDSKTGKISTQLVKLGWPIARVPTLAPHFGVGIMGQQNPETQAVPILGLDNSDIHSVTTELQTASISGGAKTFVATQPPLLVKAIAGELKIQDTSSIVNWELELFDLQPATVGGIEKDLIFGGRIDDKLCSYAAVEGLLASSASDDSSVINMVALFDDEEIGSLLRQGARGNFMPSVIERIVETFSPSAGANIMSQTYARSFLISADVTHAVNPNFIGSYLEGHSPRLNIGPAVQADGNGHTTTDSVSTAFMSRIAEKCGSTLQVFMIRNDSRSGGTVGPTLSSSMGVRAIDCGIPQLSMHSIRATTGSLDPGLGVMLYKGFFDYFEEVDAEFAD